MYDRKQEIIVDVVHSFLLLLLMSEQDVHMRRDQSSPPTSFFADNFDYEQLVVRLYNLNVELFGQSSGVVERISQEITLLSRGYLAVQWHQPGNSPPRSGPLLPTPSAPMQYGGRYYGELVAASDPAQPTVLLVPLAKMQVVASMCGWLVYSLEVAALLENQHVASSQFEPLTRRERQILALMSQRYDEQAIADALQIAPKTVQKHLENIFKRLGVHAAHHAILSGFLQAQFSPLASLTPRVGNPYEEQETHQKSSLAE